MNRHALKRILVPVDGSEPSWRAFDVAVSIAVQAGGSVDVVSVFDVRDLDADQGIYLSSEQLDEAKARHQALILDVANKHLPRPGPAMRTRLLVGVVKERLLEEISSGDYDLVVVGRTGKGFFTRMLEGSTSRALAMHSSVPVTVVP